MFRVVNILEKSGSAGYNVLDIFVYIQIWLLIDEVFSYLRSTMIFSSSKQIKKQKACYS